MRLLKLRMRSDWAEAGAAPARRARTVTAVKQGPVTTMRLRRLLRRRIALP